MSDDVKAKILQMLESMTQKELAEAVGCEQAMISFLARGLRGANTGAKLVNRIDKAYQEFIGDDKDVD